MTLKFYSVTASPVVRAVKITVKALNLKLDEIELDFLKRENQSPGYVKLNPLQTVPTLDDNGNVICDSHAINCYLVEKYGKDDSLYPKDVYKKALVNQKLAFDLGILFPLLRATIVKYARGEIKYLFLQINQTFRETYNFLEYFLEGKQWIALDCVTVADFSCVTTVTCLDYFVKIHSNTYPNITAWIKRCQTLPCFVSDHEGLKVFEAILNNIAVK